MTVGELKRRLADVDDDVEVGIAMPSDHLFAAVRSVQINPFPDRAAVLIWPAVIGVSEEGAPVKVKTHSSIAARKAEWDAACAIREALGHSRADHRHEDRTEEETADGEC